MAHDVARFNYRWKFDIKCPIASASLVIRLEDEDLISDHDAIYDPKVRYLYLIYPYSFMIYFY